MSDERCLKTSFFLITHALDIRLFKSYSFRCYDLRGTHVRQRLESSDGKVFSWRLKPGVSERSGVPSSESCRFFS